VVLEADFIKTSPSEGDTAESDKYGLLRWFKP